MLCGKIVWRLRLDVYTNFEDFHITRFANMLITYINGPARQKCEVRFTIA